MMRGISPVVLAFIGAMFAATHTSANETYLVVSINGTTNVVERIGFPVGDIKDIILAGDKYIIHANPIDSLKDSVAVDALFVMEKDNPNAAFGRTFSKPIHSVAYVPGLDVAVWSYESGYSTNLLEMAQGQSALKSAGSDDVFIPNNRQYRIYSGCELFSSSSNVVHEVGTAHKGLRFHIEDGKYVGSISLNSASVDGTEKLFTSDDNGVFILRPGHNIPLRFVSFNGVGQNFPLNNSIDNPISFAVVSTDQGQNKGKALLGYDNGAVRSSDYTVDTLGEFSEPVVMLNGSVNSMSATPNKTIRAVSTNSNETVEFDGNLSVTDKVTPNATETGYRKVITDNNDTLLLSNTHSNYFYRVKSR